MTFISVADASRRLGIDAKTLHHWLAEAQLALQSHPHDGRKKGLSREQLEGLARLHQRRLTDWPEVASAPMPASVGALPATLLALPEQLSALQTQIAALQKQVADLTCLLSQHEPAPATEPKLSSSLKRSSRPAPAARSRHSATARATPPRKPTHVIPRVEYGEEGHYVVICPRQGLLPFEPDTPAWFAWLATVTSFRFVGKAGHFSAHHRVKYGAWRAHRHLRNHSYNLSLAPSQQLTIAVLEQAAQALQAHLK